MHWLYIDFPQLALDLVCLLADKNKQDALVITDSSVHKILQVNSAAAAAGIETNMKVSTAFCLCPDLKLSLKDDQAEQQQLQSLALWAQNYSALVSIKYPQGLILEIGSMLKIFNGLPVLWQQLSQDLIKQQLSFNLAVAQTPLAAQLLAENTSGICTNSDTEIQQQLNKIPVCALPQQWSEPLSKVACKNLGELKKLPASSLGHRFGVEIIQFINRLQGRQKEPLKTFNAPLFFHRRLDFIEELEHSKGLLFFIKRLLQFLCQFLQQRQLSVTQLEYHLGHRHLPDSQISVIFSNPENQYKALFEMTGLQLESWTLPAPVTQLSLQVKHFEGIKTANPDLFQKKDQTQQSQQLFNKLQIQLTPQQLSKPMIMDDYRPEYANHFVSPATAIKDSQLNPWASNSPSWLLPQAEKTPPQSLVLLQGPERIQSAWWQNQEVKRDYYVAQHNNKGRCWVYKNAVDGHWYIQGIYA